MATDLLIEATPESRPTIGGQVETRAFARLLALAALSLIFGAVVVVKGGPQDYVSIFAWLFLFSVAWRIEAPPVRHLEFLRDWSIPLALLALYFNAREIADNLGIPVHYDYVIRFGVWVGDGDLLSARLQGWWCGTPCDPSSPPQWFDRFFILVWMSHFTVALTIAVVFWLRNRSEFVLWMRRYVVLNFAALVCYILVPTAPPWMASLDGRLPSEVVRLGARAWVGPRPEGVGSHDPTAWAGNPVAAMPSLHAAVATLIALYAIHRLRTPWRWLTLLYPLTMCTALLYLGEHYTADLAGGVVLAAVVLWGCSRWERWRARHGLEGLFARPARERQTEVESPTLAA